MTELNDVKVGDEVCAIYRHQWSQTILRFNRGKVEKVTKTQITALGDKWVKRTGRKVGSGDWSNSRLQLLTPETLAEYENHKKVREDERLCAKAANILKEASEYKAIMLRDIALQIIEIDGLEDD